MRRVLGTLVAVLALAAMTGVAAAGDYPPSTAPEPPASCNTASVSASAPMLPGATVDLTVTADSITSGASYSGTLQSTPVELPATVAASSGSVVFADVVLPADWEVEASHSIVVVDVASGQSICQPDFYVDVLGNVLANAPGGTGEDLPRTGSDTDQLVKGAAALVAIGAGIVLIARRRRATTRSAA